MKEWIIGGKYSRMTGSGGHVVLKQIVWVDGKEYGVWQKIPDDSFGGVFMTYPVPYLGELSEKLPYDFVSIEETPYDPTQIGEEDGI